LVIVDPPFGWNVADWDKPESIWDAEYWCTVLRSIQPHLLDKATLAVFGDSFNVLPQLIAGIAAYNDWAEENLLGKFVKPTELCVNKTNHPHKTSNCYSQSVEHTFLYFYKEAPKIKQFDFELGGNLVNIPRPAGSRLIPNAQREPMNPCQKSHLFLNILLRNHALPNTVVIDLTAGSFSSYMACFMSSEVYHWAGCDFDLNSFDNWQFLQNSVDFSGKDLKGWFGRWVAGNFPFSLPSLNCSFSCERRSFCLSRYFGGQTDYLA